MNKTKKVAWRKHRTKAKKYKDRQQQQAKAGGTSAVAGRR